MKLSTITKVDQHMTEYLRQHQKAKWIFAILLSAISFVTFYLIILKNYPDIADHNRFITGWLQGDESVKLYSLYYLILLVLSFFRDNLGLIHGVSMLVLVISVVAKYLLSSYIFKKQMNAVDFNGGIKLFNYKISNGFLLSLLLFTLCISQNLIYKPSATMSLGYLPINTWHNSTTIFLMPFALWLFYISHLFYKNFGESDQTGNSKNLFVSLGGILLLAILTIFIKPSYFFVFAIAFPLTWLINYGFNLKLIYTGFVSLLSAAALLVIYRYVFIGTGSSVIIDPFHVWSFWSTNIPLSFISSILFPLLFVAFYPGIFKANSLLRYGWISFIIGVLIYVLLTETGEREIHGNFSWQNVICNYILFLCTWIAYFPIVTSRKNLLLKDKILLLVYAGHFITGILFLLKLPMFGAR